MFPVRIGGMLMQALGWVTQPKAVRILLVCVVCAVIALACAVPAGGQLDLEPTNPVVISTSHTVNVWSNDNTVDVAWWGATGDTAVDGYSILWDSSSTSVPDTTINVDHTTDPHTATSPLADGDSHYFHLRTCDTSGHWTSAIHLGPFKIDTTPPTVISSPADLAVECARDVPAHDVGSVVAEDNWGDVTITWQGDVEDRSVVPATITRTYRATDGCGNYRDIAQTITLTETDSDEDGTADCDDECPDDPNKILKGICGCGNPETDTDGDGYPDCIDNCIHDPEKTSPGSCGCGIPDTDYDSDGTPDCHDACNYDPLKIDPGICGCGIPDIDTDGDGTYDCFDGCSHDFFKTSPGVCGCGVKDIDSDHDTYLDCQEGCPQDPLKISPGICGCGIPDIDTDGDGTYDCYDDCPDNPDKTTLVDGCPCDDPDSDGDGTYDCADGCPYDPLKVAPGRCGCGEEDVLFDSDFDGVLDCNDGCPTDPLKIAPGICGCGIPDTDTDGDETCDCHDACPDSPYKIDPGQCGCWLPDTDTDGDGTADCIDSCPTDPLKIAPGICGCGIPDTDTDTDGDGTPDCNDGCPYDPNRLTPGECGCGTADIDADPPTITLDALVPDPTADSTPTFTGTVSDPNCVTDIFYRTRKNGGAWSDWIALAGLTCSASANFSFELGPLADGVYDVEAKAVDDLGNTTAEADYVGDTFIVAISPIAKSVGVSDTPICDADIPGTATFEVTVDFDEAMDTGVDPTLAFNPEVATTLTLNTGQSGWTDNDTYVAKYDVADAGVEINNIDVTVSGGKDISGNTQQPYTKIDAFDIDTREPNTPTVTGIADDNGSSNTDAITNDNTLIISGTAEANSTVEVFRDSVSIGTLLANVSGYWTFYYTGTTLSDGSYSFTASARDAAGNTSAISSALNVLIDMDAPPTPGGRSPADGTYTNDNTPTFSWDAVTDPGNSGVRDYHIIVYDSTHAEAKNSYPSSPHYTPAESSPLTDGTYTWKLATRDIAGNTGVWSDEWTFVFDTEAPTISSITSSTPDGCYNVGAIINVTVSFSEEVALAGGPLDITLDSGTTISISPFGPATGASGTYTVCADENSCDLDATDITLNGATLQDRAGNDADMTFPTTTIADGSDIVVDTTNPVIDPMASDQTVECDGAGNVAERDTWLNSHGGASATDNCGGVTWTNDFTGLSDDCGETGLALVTFTATDCCGHSSTTQATFTIEDTASPSITTPASNETVECDGSGNAAELNAWLSNHGGAVASDTCCGTNVTWSNDFAGLSDDCGETGSSLVTFTATDCCGHGSTTQATFTIEDTTSPSITTPASDKTVECDGSGNNTELNAWLANYGGAVASDICCGTDVTWSNDFAGLSDGCGETGSALVTFTATDCCGHSSTTQATFAIEDTTNPTIVWNIELPDSTQYVDSTFCAIAFPIQATVTDTCCVLAEDVSVDISASSNATLLHGVIVTQMGDNVVVAGIITVSNLSGCPAVLSVAINADDCCGNVATQLTDSVEIYDNTVPVINDLVVDDHVLVSDDCCETTVNFTANVTDNCCIIPDNVAVTVTLPTGNATLENIIVNRAQNGQGQVNITGSADVRCLTSCPARVEVHIEATDCCGNNATPVTSTTTEGRVYDETPPEPKDDPNDDENRSASDNLEVRLGLDLNNEGEQPYRLMVRENTPVRIDVIYNDDDNCSSCTCCGTMWIHDIVNPPEYGTVMIEVDHGDCNGGSIIRYAPYHGYIGPDEFTYRIVDACGNVSATATVYLEVVRQTVMDDIYLTTCVDRPVSFAVKTTDLWVEPDNPGEIPFVFSIFTPPMHGVVSGDLGDVTYEVHGATTKEIESATITLIYTPATGFTGRDALTLRFADPFGGSSTAVVDIAVIKCAGQPGAPPLFVVQQGEIFPMIVPLTFASVYETAWDTVTLIAETDRTTYQGALSATWEESIGRYVLRLDTALLPPGLYQITIPLGNGETVTLMIEVGEVI
jgi:hypothetical protein